MFSYRLITSYSYTRKLAPAMARFRPYFRLSTPDLSFLGFIDSTVDCKAGSKNIPMSTTMGSVATGSGRSPEPGFGS